MSGREGRPKLPPEVIDRMLDCLCEGVPLKRLADIEGRTYPGIIDRLRKAREAAGARTLYQLVAMHAAKKGSL